MIDRKKTYGFYVAGFFMILLLGVLFYFAFELSNSHRLVALFSPVNRSLWESLKLGLWPAVFFSLIEFIGYGFRNRNFFIAKAVAFYLIVFFMASFFYAYTALLGRQTLFMDFVVFLLAVMIAQIISYRVMIRSGRSTPNGRIFSFILILVLLLAFTVLTYYPIRHEIFTDPMTGSIGIINGS